jgi:hypothetical protein
VSLRKINLAEKPAMFDSHWAPHVVATYNGNDVIVVKFTVEPNSGDSDRPPASKQSI